MKDYKFGMKAMNGDLSLTIVSESESYAYSAFHDVELEIMRLEDKLSVFRDGTDTAMINAMSAGDTGMISYETLECLRLSAQAHEMSSGAIDVCMGEFFLMQKGLLDSPPENPSKLFLKIDTENFMVEKVSGGMLDFGAIGKGYAVDLAVRRLKEEWELESAFVSFASSSIYGFGRHADLRPWNVTFGGEKTEFSEVDGFAIGGSGTAVQGEHIIDPRRPHDKISLPFRTWAVCESAAIADAMSTAFMIMDDDEIRSVCKEYGIKALIQRVDGGPITRL